MPSVTLFKGLPGSGKTTKAKELVANSEGRIKRVNKDDLREMLDAGKFSKEREKNILAHRNALIASTVLDGFDVIVDDTNLHQKHFDEIAAMLNGIDPDVEVLVDDSFCKVSVKECIRRDALREKPVGKSVIRRMAIDFGVGQIEPYYIEGLPSCVICDLDGTLAHMGKRNPFDASTCEQDKLNEPLANLIRFLSKDYTIMFFSGRQEKDREPTLRWLDKHGLIVGPVLLSMRPTNNSEKDFIIKSAMFEKHIRGQYNVHMVFDDRNQCVDLWRDLGLTCFQVAEGDF